MSGSTDLEMDYNTFSNCVRLKKITLSDRVKSIPREFACQDELLEEVVWPATLTSIGSNAFYGDKLLVSSDLSGTKLATIGESAFNGCTEFPLVKLPAEGSLIIKEHAFDGTSMKDGDKDGELLISANVTEIGNYAFDETKYPSRPGPDGRIPRVGRGRGGAVRGRGDGRERLPVDSQDHDDRRVRR